MQITSTQKTLQLTKDTTTTMNNPPLAPKDRRQLPDDPQAQRVQVHQGPVVGTPLPTPLGVSALTPPQIPGLSLQGGLPPVAMGDISILNKVAQVGGKVPAMLAAPGQPKLDPMNLLGAAAVVQQQQQIQNATILRSLMDQKQQITKCEEEIRRRMMLPPSGPLLQAHLVQNLPGGMGLMGSLGTSFNQTLPTTTTLGQTPPPNELAFRGDGRSLRGGVVEPFPEKLHRLLQESEAAGLSDVISFVANGRAFAIHKPERFFKEIVPQYFRHKRLSSFKRQLNLYGFELISSGPARGAYYHKLFIEGKPELCATMRRSVTSKAYSKSREPQPEFVLYTPTSSDPKEAPSNDEGKADSDHKSAVEADSDQKSVVEADSDHKSAAQAASDHNSATRAASVHNSAALAVSDHNSAAQADST